MTNFTTLKFPAQMRPEVAHHTATALCWAPPESTLVGATALCLLYASWHATRAETITRLAARLDRLAKNPDSMMAALVDTVSYEKQGAKYGAGQVLLTHVSQAIAVWVEQITTTDSQKLFASIIKMFRAAGLDTTDRAEHMATSVEDFIAAHPEHGAEDGNSPDVFIAGPHGQPLGPFPSRRAAMAYQKAAMIALSQGQPLPPIPGQEVRAFVPLADEAATSPGVVVYSRAAAVNHVQGLPPAMPGEGNSQQRRLLEAMANSDGRRELTMVPDGDPLAVLYQNFPHFSKVLDFVSRRLALAGCGSEGKPVRIPPMLLRGVQGTGKSYFAKMLARVLGTYYVERDLAVMTDAFVISGMDSGWKGSKPGIVFDAVVNGRTANPLICLNEIDKAANSVGKSSVAALYTLLEKENAMNFTDEFVPIAIDVSRVIWVCTANEGDIPAPILDRFEVFDIKEPTPAECRLIASSVWSNICATELPAGHGFPAELGDPALDAMSVMRPRVMRKTLEDAASEAIVNGRRYVSLEDLAISQHRNKKVAPQPMGFVH